VSGPLGLLLALLHVEAGPRAAAAADPGPAANKIARQPGLNSQQTKKMPPASNPFQRVLYNGVPYWKDAAGTLYYYESSTPPTEASKIRLGTESAGLDTDWFENLAETLEAYRTAATSRSRLPTNTVAAAAAK
jgi:hypothetical protein